MKKNILIFGASGLLGKNWIKLKKDQFNISVVINKKNISDKNINKYKINFNKKNEIKKIFHLAKPDIVINLVALTNLEKCQKNKKLSYKTNYLIPSMIANQCRYKKIKFVHISTDQIFSKNHKFKSEKFSTDPINHYGYTKALIEKYIVKNLKNYLILRTNFFGIGSTYRQSFSEYIINNLKRNKKINLYEDVYFNPVFIDNLINYIHMLINKDCRGIFNISSSDRISKYQFGILICRSFRLNKELINPIKVNAGNNIIKRPKEMSLSNKKISKLLNLKIGITKDQINFMKKKLFVSNNV